MLELTVRLIASLAIVIGLLLLLAKFGARRFGGRSGDLVRVVHRQPLSRTSGVAVVAIGARVLVLGTTEQHVTVLAELDPDEIDEAGLDSTQVEAADAHEVPHLVVAPQAAPAARPAGAHRAEQPVRPGRPSRAARGDSPLTGSVLSADTWRQALAAATGTGKAS